jgi:hypothetical protein
MPRERVCKENSLVLFDLSYKNHCIKKSFVLAPTYSRANALPSALESLTAVFGMGTGVTSLEGAPRQKILSFVYFVVEEKLV